MSAFESNTLPLPLDPLPDNKLEDRRLWIGNLDSRITEYKLLKLLQKHGTIEKFDFLFHHRSGASAGQPRGYAFVTYTTSENAVKAKDKVDGITLGYKRLVVRWAKSVSKDDLEKPKPELKIPALAGAKTEEKKSRQTTIQAIEAKLKFMEHHSSNEFEVNNVPIGSLFTSPKTVSKQTNSMQRSRERYDSLKQINSRLRSTRERYDSQAYRKKNQYRR